MERYVGWSCVLISFMLSSLPCFPTFAELLSQHLLIFFTLVAHIYIYICIMAHVFQIEAKVLDLWLCLSLTWDLLFTFISAVFTCRKPSPVWNLNFAPAIAYNHNHGNITRIHILVFQCHWCRAIESTQLFLQWYYDGTKAACDGAMWLMVVTRVLGWSKVHDDHAKGPMMVTRPYNTLATIIKTLHGTILGPSTTTEPSTPS